MPRDDGRAWTVRFGALLGCWVGFTHRRVEDRSPCDQRSCLVVWFRGADPALLPGDGQVHRRTRRGERKSPCRDTYQSIHHISGSRQPTAESGEIQQWPQHLNRATIDGQTMGQWCRCWLRVNRHKRDQIRRTPGEGNRLIVATPQVTQQIQKKASSKREKPSVDAEDWTGMPDRILT